MKINLLHPGFKDDLHDHASIEHNYKNQIINLFLSNGYKLVKPPLIEYNNLKNIENNFIIKEKKELKELLVRNDITMQVARLASSRLSNETRPLKLCYYGEVVRKNVSIIRPERQFLQVGAECIGEDSFLADVEILDLAYKSLNLVGIKNMSIELSSSEFLDYLIDMNSKKKDHENVKSFLRKKDINNALKFIDFSLNKFAKNLFSCTGIFNEKKELLKKIAVNDKTKFASEKLIKIYENFNRKNPNVNIFLDLTETNYFEYHSGSKFTFFAENIRGEIARGGRYISNKKNLESSVGFTCYMDTIVRASSLKQKVKKILIPFETSKTKKDELINKGYILETFFDKKNNIKKFANEKKINYCLIDNKIIVLNI